MTDTPGELIHISLVAERLGLSVYQTQGLVEKGKLPATKIGNRTYMAARAVDDYIEGIAKAAS